MKYKAGLSICLSLGLMATFWGGMAIAKEGNTFFIEDISGARDYLNEFPVKGVAGDGTHAFMFTIADGAVQTKEYPFGIASTYNLFLAQEVGIEGFAQYGYLGKRMEEDSLFYGASELVSSPEAKVTIREEGSMLALGEGEDLRRGRDYLATAPEVDFYMNITRRNPYRGCRVFSGVSLVGQDTAFGSTHWGDTLRWGGYRTDMVPKVFMVEKGTTAYVLQSTNAQCVGESILFRVKKESMTGAAEEAEPVDWTQMYTRETYGGAEALTAFPVDGDHSVLGMGSAGNNHLAVVYTKEDALLLGIYDLEGVQVAEETLMATGAKSVGAMDMETIDFADGSASLLYAPRQRDIVHEDYREQGAYLPQGLLQWKDGTLTKVRVTKEDGVFLAMVKDDLVFEMARNEGSYDKLVFVPSGTGETVATLRDVTKGEQRFGMTMTVSHGLTGEVLYEGFLVTDFAQDKFNAVANWKLQQDGTFVQNISGGYLVSDTMSLDRMRGFEVIVPLEARLVKTWL